MGIIRMGPPEDIVCILRDATGIEQFIETGTYQGATAAWASKHFKRVITIENSDKYYNVSKRYLSQFKNVEVLKGDSRHILPQLLSENPNPTIFWLDAHYCCDAYGKDDECPLLEEIRQIGKTPCDHILLIDDARLFLAPPPKPHNPNQWPNIFELLTLLEKNGQYSVIVEDVIISVPRDMKLMLVECTQDYFSKKIQNGERPERTILGHLKGLVFRERM